MPRPARVTREATLRAALRVVDREGLAALTMRRLGEELGADAAMIYRIFPGKDDLLEALADQVFGEAPERGAATVGTSAPADWYESLRLSAHGIRQALLAHPALIEIAVRRPPRQAGTFRGMDAGVGLLRGAGLSRREAAHDYQAVLFYALGFAVLEAPFAAAVDGGRADQEATQRAIKALPPHDYPHLAAASSFLYDADLTTQFDHGLRLLLDGVARHAEMASREDRG
jgi:TetR/AcrR family tetracycline transcriptional repressor